MVPNTAYFTRDLDRALLNALKWLDTPEVMFKPEQRSAVAKFACGRLPTGFGKYLCFQMLLFVDVGEVCYWW